MGNKIRNYVDLQAFHPEVTGSCFYLNIVVNHALQYKLLIDFGMYHEENYEDLNQVIPVDLSEIDAVLVTHNHIDHTGKLPLLYLNGFKGQVYATDLTSQLMGPALRDTANIFKLNAKRKKEHFFYSSADVQNLLDHVIGCSYNTKIDLAPFISMMFLPNQHLLGAASILLKIKPPHQKAIFLLFTGDYAKNNLLFSFPPLPSNIYKKDITIIQEATYGAMSTKEIIPCLENNILHAIAEGKTVICPAFALGRYQEMMYLIRLWQDSNKLSKDIPIYLDGNLPFAYNAIIQKNPTCLNANAKRFYPHHCDVVSDDKRPDLLSNSPKIIITTSGMGSQGPAYYYIQQAISLPHVLFHFLGYMAENTLGRKLQEVEKGDTFLMSGMVLQKNADVVYTNELSAHAKQDELLSYLRDFSHINCLLTNHSQTSTNETYVKYVKQQNLGIKKIGIAKCNFIYRIDAYGLVKQIPLS